MLLALQKTCFSLSELPRVSDKDDTVKTKPSVLSFEDVERLVISVDDMCHVMLAGGSQYDVVQVILICCPERAMIGAGVIVTDVTGTEIIKT